MTLDIPVTEYVFKKLASGFTKRGINIIDSSNYSLSVQIKTLKVWEKADGLNPEYANCELELNFLISNNRMPVYQGQISSSAVGTESIIDATESNGPVLESCMEYAIEKFVKDEKLSSLLGFQSISKK